MGSPNSLIPDRLPNTASRILPKSQLIALLDEIVDAAFHEAFGPPPVLRVCPHCHGNLAVAPDATILAGEYYPRKSSQQLIADLESLLGQTASSE